MLETIQEQAFDAAKDQQHQQRGVDEINVLINVDQMTDLSLDSGASSSFAHEQSSSEDGKRSPAFKSGHG